jgi:hypothetical protein
MLIMVGMTGASCEEIPYNNRLNKLISLCALCLCGKMFLLTTGEI